MGAPRQDLPGAGRRSRVRIASALVVVILLGLGSRSGHAAVPGWVAQHAGDALWATALYLGLALLAARGRPWSLFALTLLLSLLVELSQLWHAAWLEALRDTLVGRLLLGVGWQWSDLPRYAVGAGLALGLDCAWLDRYALDRASLERASPHRRRQ